MLLRLGLVLAAVAGAGYGVLTYSNVNPSHKRGEEIDRLNGVAVHYNGGINQASGRNLSPDGYNYGLRWQCTEFVRRYYDQALGHRMPDTWGDARSLFDPALESGALNPARGLIQYTNGTSGPPAVNDLVIFAPRLLRPWGHAAIVSAAAGDAVEIVQQNPGPFSPSREVLALDCTAGACALPDGILGWLRLPPTPPETDAAR
ncbi:CHAP domain-containing protein [Phaeovibrio sulfidiphilus]|uniref:CHAP domain-containing protein n=2 Tax=Phaeovibrio sulfidiphilus TaxID=1220600 RepID=A0A8J7CWH0_9PROT|nr:CHAP domain-containing protein [Phaeovibrio sulfidiphilus]